MKQIVFFLLFATLFIACKERCICTGYTTNGNPCRCILFQAKVGNDFDSASDSLKRLYQSKFIELESTGYYSGKGYFMAKEKINVDFIYDDRDFFWLTFIDSINIYRTLQHGML